MTAAIQAAVRRELGWRLRARCAADDVDPEIFFSAFGESDQARAVRVATARAVCAACPVRRECLADAYDVPDAWAIRAGTLPGQRRRVRRARERGKEGAAAA